MRILAIDPGEKRIGIAISDPTGTIASPYKVINHISRVIDAAQIVQIASENEVKKIVVGQSTTLDGKPSLSGRRAIRLAAAIQSQTGLPVVLWDEANSTRVAKAARIEMGVRRRQRQGHLDEIAAVIILQSYLDSQAES